MDTKGKFEDDLQRLCEKYNLAQFSIDLVRLIKDRNVELNPRKDGWSIGYRNSDGHVVYQYFINSKKIFELMGVDEDVLSYIAEQR